MKVAFCILAIAVGLSQGAAVVKDEVAKFMGQKIDVKTLEDLQQARADASEYFDLVLANVREVMLISGLNSIPLPDENLEFSQEIGGIVWHGTAALYNGSLLHLDTIHRTGIADLSVEPNGDTIISAEVGVNKGTVHYEMIAKFMDLGPHAIVDGTLSRVRILMALRINLEELNVVLETFSIEDTGTLSVEIKGLGAILNFLVEIVTGFLGNLIKGIVVFFLEGTIQDIINDIIQNILFPPELATSIPSAIKAVQNIVSAAI